jgi:ABC-type uncharacterized transport system ATPase component
MPITNTLDVSRRLTQVGVPAAQAEVLSELFEGTAQDAVREMKAIVAQEGERTRTELRAEMQALRNELRAEFQTELKELELRVAERLRSQMLWFFTVQTALLGIAVAVIKLFP